MKRIKRSAFFLIVMSCLSFSLLQGFSIARTFNAEVVAISSGDTIKVLKAGEVITIRLEGIDCPNKGQAYSQEAKQFSETLVYGKVVTIVSNARNRQGQTVAKVILPSGKSLNQELIKSGLAWWNLRSSRDSSLGALERAVREKKVGLWQEKMPLPPWEHPNKKVAMRR